MWLGKIYYTIMHLWIYLDEPNYSYGVLSQKQKKNIETYLNIFWNGDKGPFIYHLIRWVSFSQIFYVKSKFNFYFLQGYL